MKIKFDVHGPYDCCISHNPQMQQSQGSWTSLTKVQGKLKFDVHDPYDCCISHNPQMQQSQGSLTSFTQK